MGADAGPRRACDSSSRRDKDGARLPPTLVLKVVQPGWGRVQPQASGLSTQGSLQGPERAGDAAERDGIKMAQITPRKEGRRNRGEKGRWDKQKTSNKW